jgi:transposase
MLKEGMFERRAEKQRQEQFWIETKALPAATASRFYERVNETLAQLDFAREVWAICEPAYAQAARGGRPGIDPVVYLKMLMVGFFEDLPSERAIASRCADSLSIRGFLGYELSDATPEHSSLSVIRNRLSGEAFDAIHLVLLRALRGHGLLRGRQLGIDSSVIEANASLRALEHRNTEQSYWDYVRGLAAAAGVDPDDTKAVRRFDKKRSGRKTSNQDWVNPHDPEAKVGRTKDGATDMIYKPEHVTDLESGAIVSAEVRPGDAADCTGAAERILAAIGTLAEVAPQAAPATLGGEVAADEGYFAVAEIAQLQSYAIRAVVADPQIDKRRKDAPPEIKRVLRRARCATRSASGKALLRQRGQHLERAFCHVLDHGGLRRATLRGTENLSKRYLMGALSFNLSLLLRTLFGIGTPKQWLAAPRRAVFAFWSALIRLITLLCQQGKLLAYLKTTLPSHQAKTICSSASSPSTRLTSFFQQAGRG